MKLNYSLIIFAIMGLLWGCSSKSTEEKRSESRNRIAILNDQSAGVDPAIAIALAETLQTEGFVTTFFSAREV